MDILLAHMPNLLVGTWADLQYNVWLDICPSTKVYANDIFFQILKFILNSGIKLSFSLQQNLFINIFLLLLSSNPGSVPEVK